MCVLSDQMRGVVCWFGMDMQIIESESLAAVGYDPARLLLRLQFRAGGLYEYDGVPQRIWRELMRAESKGRYFIDEIRGRYPYHRVT
ncbi:KTSC domain-containing protein [Roseiterribacter gracilis]|uniref:KTSC domain-containing protein n=1 Tax=Roseiterribacter gracilis TaxID=2812848 RepID=A0A8S8XIC1_9PROT|nr:hypothetical protein TMPK1_39260 [Rhodospirillales bacterium TMPK1]